MGCQCAHSESETKSELINLNAKEMMGNNFMKDNNNIEILKSSVSESAFNNFQSIPNADKESIPINSSLKNENDLDKEQNYKNYSQKMFELINKIRTNPSYFADIIENSIENIWEENSKTNDGKNKIVYKDRVKVSLNRGEPAFREAVSELREISPISPLEFKNEICIPLPENEEDIKNSDYLKEQVKIIRTNNKIDVFYKDLIKDPDVSALLMIVDDNTKNPGKKRQAVLDDNFKYIGISSGFVGKTFIAYFSFSK